MRTPLREVCTPRRKLLHPSAKNFAPTEKSRYDQFNSKIRQFSPITALLNHKVFEIFRLQRAISGLLVDVLTRCTFLEIFHPLWVFALDPAQQPFTKFLGYWAFCFIKNMGDIFEIILFNLLQIQQNWHSIHTVKVSNAYCPIRWNILRNIQRLKVDFERYLSLTKVISLLPEPSCCLLNLHLFNF